MPGLNEWDWLTTAEFLSFVQAKNITLDCDRCPSKFPAVFIDTVTDEGLIARSSTFGNDDDSGAVSFNKSRHLPCVRVICRNCGHVNLHSMYAVRAWKTGGDYG